MTSVLPTSTDTDPRVDIAPVSTGRSEATPPAVVIENLSKRFPAHQGWFDLVRHPFSREYREALRDISLTVEQGEFFGLLGPNGAGKTTLFRILATSVLPDEGTATVMGFEVDADAAKVRSQVTQVMADERTINWRLSARENLRMFAALYGIHGARTKPAIEEVLDAVGLADIDERLVARFSSGMKQRLMIARALLTRPRVLLLDEPTRSLDPISARSLRQFLRRELIERQGATVLLATHSPEEALELCDRVAVLNRGQLLATGVPAVLARTYGEQIYRFWVTGPTGLDVLRRLADTVGAQVIGAGPDEADQRWTVAKLLIPGGDDASAPLIGALVAAGVPVSRVERVPMPLAE